MNCFLIEGVWKSSLYMVTQWHQAQQIHRCGDHNPNCSYLGNQNLSYSHHLIIKNVMVIKNLNKKILIIRYTYLILQWYYITPTLLQRQKIYSQYILTLLIVCNCQYTVDIWSKSWIYLVHQVQPVIIWCSLCRLYYGFHVD